MAVRRRVLTGPGLLSGPAAPERPTRPAELTRPVESARPAGPPRLAAVASRWVVAVDVVLAALLAAVAWLFGGLRPTSPAETASLALILAAVVVRRPWPWAAWTLGLAGGLIQVADGLGGLVALAGVLLVLYSVTAYGPRLMLLLTGLILPVAAVAGSITLLQRGTGVERIAYALLPGPIPGGTIGQGAVLYLAVLAPVAATYLAGLARRSVLKAQQAAVRESVAAADSERAAQLAAVQGQRADLAREVHDVVGHSLTVIIAQADSVRFRDMNAADGPEQVQATVAAIAATARDSLGEIREVLARLGQPEPGLSEPDEHQSGQPAGDTLPELFARVRQAGVALTVRHEGEPSDAGPDERAVLVAVTREMLTNALRHGDRAAPVDVLLRWSCDGVLIRVRNREGTGDGTGLNGSAGSTGSAGSGSGAGRGIPGMRARLSRVGGTLGTAREPRPDGGQDFVADAWVPGRTG
ncbi:MAG TPA: histidine kinase [Streptosporangiaceae bacterium]|nr:histidine kinase [Streptosporangiaceae bacterium]